METKRLLLGVSSGDKGDNITNSSTARVIIVDPTQYFCTGMRNCLAAGKHVVLGEARNLEEALHQLETLNPDLVVIGQNIAEHESLEICREITSRWPHIKTIIYTTLADDPLFQTDAVYAGASACLPIGTGDAECLAAITAVMSGHQLFPREILTEGLHPVALTPREREVLKLLAEGKTDKEIAQTLTLAFRTVRNHAHNILQKLDSRNRHEAVQRAKRRGLV